MSSQARNLRQKLMFANIFHFQVIFLLSSKWPRGSVRATDPAAPGSNLGILNSKGTAFNEDEVKTS